MKKAGCICILFLFLFANIQCSSGPKTIGPPYSGALVDQYSSAPNRLLVIETKVGTMKIQLFDKIAPNHIAQIMKLAQDGKYDSLTFHRVKEGFIQGGDPYSKGDDQSVVGSGGMGSLLKAEFSDIPFQRGVCGMALGSNENSASSQFFICAENQHGFTHRYTVWGQVVDGYATLDSIASFANNKKYHHASDGSVNPWRDAMMTKVFIQEQQ
jgi:cyclophilin family peptidyl-prolyl cis-trans isomerase